ncbi:MAG TPA: DsbA family protein [Candidatus Limnocylindrales bacterium]|nr:DsbA family protein [Candidatus Limnocylindrales bacterium]
MRENADQKSSSDASRFDPLRSDRPLIVYVDLKSPYAYLAKDPTRALARRLGIAVDWRPLSLDIPSFAGSARLDSGDNVAESQRSAAQWTWVKYAYGDARRYAKMRGLTLRGTVKIWDTTLAGIAMQWAKAHGDDILARFLDRTFESFWKRELDAESLEVIERVLGESGADVAGFAAHADAARPAYLAEQHAIFDAGIFGVPGYVVEGEYYWGREHLPRIGWILEGRRGPAPDIVYPRETSAA